MLLKVIINFHSILNDFIKCICYQFLLTSMSENRVDYNDDQFINRYSKRLEIQRRKNKATYFSSAKDRLTSSIRLIVSSRLVFQCITNTSSLPQVTCSFNVCRAPLKNRTSLYHCKKSLYFPVQHQNLHIGSGINAQ